MLPCHLLDHREGGRDRVPERLVRLGRPDLVAEQHHAALGVGERIQGRDEVRHGLLDIDHVCGDDEVEAARGGKRGEMRGAVPVELREAGRAGEVDAVAPQVAAERGEDGGDVGEDEVGEAEAGEAESCRAAPGAELHGPGAGEAEHVGEGEGRVAEAALDELDEDQGRGPHRGAHLEGVVVLLERQHRASHRKLHYRRRGEPHLHLSAAAAGPSSLKRSEGFWAAAIPLAPKSPPSRLIPHGRPL